MTGTTVAESNWGERRVARRRRQRWMATGLMAIAAGFFIWLAPASDSQAADAARLISALAFTLFVAVGAFLSWRLRDEVERRQLIEMLAAIGAAAMLLMPLAGMLAPVLHISEPGFFAWLVALAIGIVVRSGQRIRA